MSHDKTLGQVISEFVNTLTCAQVQAVTDSREHRGEFVMRTWQILRREKHVDRDSITLHDMALIYLGRRDEQVSPVKHERMIRHTWRGL